MSKTRSNLIGLFIRSLNISLLANESFHKEYRKTNPKKKKIVEKFVCFMTVERSDEGLLLQSFAVESRLSIIFAMYSLYPNKRFAPSSPIVK